MASVRTKEDLIFRAYLNGWSRRDSARIFNVSERQIRKITAQATKNEKRQHISKNRQDQSKFYSALRGFKVQYQQINDKKPSKSEISDRRKIWKDQKIYGAKSSYGISKKYRKSRTTTWTAFIEAGE